MRPCFSYNVLLACPKSTKRTSLNRILQQKLRVKCGPPIEAELSLFYRLEAGDPFILAFSQICYGIQALQALQA
jgi:hypothetical protein